MTFIGRILVIVITALSLLFLGISTVVFTTSKIWSKETSAQQSRVEELKKKLTDAQARSDVVKKALEDAKATFDQTTKALNSRLSQLTDDNTRNLTQINAVRDQLKTATQAAKATLDEVEAKRQEIAVLRRQKADVDRQTNDYKLHQADLTDRIRELERELETATKQQSDLRERVAKFSVSLRQN
jgi:chromosome segregation ATPase